MPNDKRIIERIELRIRVVVTLSDNSVVKLWSQNLSHFGVGVIHDYPADMGSRFLLQFSIRAGNEARTIKVMAEVVHNHLMAGTGSYLIGFRFLDLADEDGKAIDTFVRDVKRQRR